MSDGWATAAEFVVGLLVGFMAGKALVIAAKRIGMVR